MITKRERERAIQHAWKLCQQTGIPLLDHEIGRIEVADFGLSEFEASGLAILALQVTQEVGIKLIALYPWQVCPEHRHPPQGDYPGKEEIFRGQWGEVSLYVPGEPTPNPKGQPPPHRRDYCTVWHEIVLRPGDQYRTPPDTWHWFQAGPDGAVLWSFSSKVTDAEDVFLDPEVTRQTIIRD